MPINQILPFATGSGANVMTPADYAALPAQTHGFTAGIASSQQLNTVWRQASFMSSMLAQFISDKAGVDVLDNGDIGGLESNLTKAVTRLAGNISDLSLNITTDTTLDLTYAGSIIGIQNTGVTVTIPDATAPASKGKVFYFNKGLRKLKRIISE